MQMRCRGGSETRAGLLAYGILSTLLVALVACSPSPNEPRVDSRRLAQASAILNDTLRTEMVLAPDLASRMGLSDIAGDGSESRLSDYSQAGFERARLLRLDLLDQLGKRPVLPDEHPLARDLRITTDAYVRLSRIQSSGHGRFSLEAAYPFAIDPYGGIWVDGPDLLSHIHRVATLEDAEAYVLRLAALADAIADIRRRMIADAETGILLPRPALTTMRDQIAAMMLATSPTLASLTTDLENLMLGVPEISPAQRDALLQDARLVLEQDLYPAYADLLRALDTLEPQAPPQAGLWAQASTSDLFLSHLAWKIGSDIPATDTLHRENLAEAETRRAALENAFRAVWMSANSERASDTEIEPPDLSLDTLQTLYAARPEDALPIGTPSSITRQQSVAEHPVSLTGQDFVLRAVDGSRPDLLLTSDAQMQTWPAWLAELLQDRQFHQATHAMADATAGSAERTPLRALIRVHTVDEGWRSYRHEVIVGQLSGPPDWTQLAWHHWLLVEAVLAVADTGLHAERWETDAATDYIARTALLPQDLARDAVTYLASNPGQFTSRRHGARRIMSLRNRAIAVLADRFQQSEFDRAVLSDGSRPLAMVVEDVERWYEGQLPAAD